MIASKEVDYELPRRHETIINRLKLGRCQLNYYLFKMKRHSTGLCASCGKNETIQHYLMECSNSALVVLIDSECQKQKIKRDIGTILNNTTILKVITNHYDRV